MQKRFSFSPFKYLSIADFSIVVLCGSASSNRCKNVLKKEFHVVEHEMVSSVAMVLLLRVKPQRFPELHGGFRRNLCCFQKENYI